MWGMDKKNNQLQMIKLLKYKHRMFNKLIQQHYRLQKLKLLLKLKHKLKLKLLQLMLNKQLLLKLNHKLINKCKLQPK